MIAASGIELRAGSRLLLDGATFRIAAGRPGRPGRPQRRRQDHADQGARRRGPAGRRLGDPHRRGRLPAAGPAHRRPARHWPATGSCPPAASTASSRRCARPRARWPAPTTRRATRRCAATRRLEGEFTARAGMPPSPRPRPIASALALEERVLGPAARAPSPVVSAAGSSWPGSCSPAPQTLLLDEPTNHLDADSIVWLRDYLKGYQGGLVVISHDVDLLDAVVNQVFHLDANRGRARPLQRRLEALPPAARDRRARAASASAPTPRRRPPR